MTSYENRTKEELLELAAERDIEGRSYLNKDELIAALRGDEPEGESQVEEPEAEEEDTSPGFESETPSALAAAAAPAEHVAEGDPGDPDGPHWQPDDQEAVLAQGEAYQAEKKKHRWG